MKKIIHTSEAPEAIGPYSQAVVYNGIVHCSGQIGLEPETMEYAGEDVESQAKQVMQNLEAVLKKAGSDFSKVIKCSIYLDQMDDFGTVNEIYGNYFGENPPARETVAVDTLPKNAKVEISCVAYV
ncbi:RidA family protein [Aliifodinibius sp. S!AR15-10]|uniref:RidA family protein n=1 Tax=Aliifodinibius sp. S!AR15-10 TaxID=2950437 RepID=UPI0028595938|nr:RidA family protein [Aliifodinibius sp. S!AR15-10]MDR8392149.1 RidA family protein [Aliifodinibius sp. S!AR15-10]